MLSNSRHLPKYYFWLANKLIQPFQPKEINTLVLIADLDAEPLRYKRKVDPLGFFPPFCRVLARYGIGSKFVHDIKGIEQAAQQSNHKSILINLVDEDKPDISKYDFPGDLSKEFRAVFNSYSVARIVSDKMRTNDYLSTHGIAMPRCNSAGADIFSLPKTGYGHTAAVVDDIESADADKYNTEFIDTRVQFQGKHYYTSLRLMCIGPAVLKILVQARDCDERNPAARNRNTPQDPSLLRHLNAVQVAANLDKLHSLAEDIWRVLGPGFYAHDVLVEAKSGRVLLCESEYKFYPEPFMKKFRGLMDNEDRLVSTCEQASYARIAASVFLEYCNKLENGEDISHHRVPETVDSDSNT